MVYSPGIFNQRYFAYLLEAVKDWKDKIKKAEIIINFKEITKEHLISAKPEGYKHTKTGIKWTMINLVPEAKDNIRVDYKCYKDYEEVVENKKNNIKNWQNTWLLAYAANKAQKYEQTEDFVNKGLELIKNTKLSVDEEIDDEVINERQMINQKYFPQIILYHQLVKARFEIYNKDKSDENKKSVVEIFEKIKDLTAKVMKNDDALDKVFDTENIEAGLCTKILSEDIVSDNFINSWKATSFFQGQWEKMINEAINPPKDK